MSTAKKSTSRKISKPSERAVKPATNAPQVVFVFQGGGALGSYQGGVYETLAAGGYAPDWVVGTSIGAINAAIIAGNPPERRLAKLKEFWHLVSRDDQFMQLSQNPFTAWLQPWLNPWVNASRSLETIAQGIPGFFEPRKSATWDLNQQVSTQSASFYDTSPLKATLERLVDFDYLNSGKVRISICAVEVTNGELMCFDSKKTQINASHIMASGALPPGFPPVVIDGKAYWDGGIYSNTPVDVVLDDANRKDTLCFMVDLWDPTETEPKSISEAMTRHKDIQYASRSLEHLDDHKTMQNMRKAIQFLSSHLSAKDRADPAISKLTEMGCASNVNVVRLIMKALPNDDYSKDIDFSRDTLAIRWKAGACDAQRALDRKAWLTPLPPHVGMVVHELPQTR